MWCGRELAVVRRGDPKGYGTSPTPNATTTNQNENKIHWPRPQTTRIIGPDRSDRRGEAGDAKVPRPADRPPDRKNPPHSFLNKCGEFPRHKSRLNYEEMGQPTRKPAGPSPIFNPWKGWKHRRDRSGPNKAGQSRPIPKLPPASGLPPPTAILFPWIGGRGLDSPSSNWTGKPHRNKLIRLN